MAWSGNFAYRIYQRFWVGIDLLYPPICGGCGKRSVRWCQDCQSEVQLILPPLCLLCGRIQSKPGICSRCKASPSNFEVLRSWAVFTGPVRKAIHNLKYQRDMSLGEKLAHPLIEYVSKAGWELDMVIPVPLGVARQRQRGYNQAALLAKPLAMSLNFEYNTKALTRIRETRSQVGLSLDRRRINVSGAFTANSKIIAEKKCLIVDDVTTSGATMNACASALAEAGARNVFGLTLARAIKLN